jgi:putative acetyltransferase
MVNKEINIRVSKEEDGKYLFSWLNDPEVLPWFPLDNVREIEDAIRIWLSYREIGAAFTICLNDIPVGMAVIYLHRYKKLRHQSLFAIILDKNFRSQGLGSKLMHHVIFAAKKNFGVEVLHLEVYEGNPAKNLYDRLGFKEYGRQECFLKEKNGIYRNKINMELEL